MAPDRMGYSQIALKCSFSSGVSVSLGIVKHLSCGKHNLAHLSDRQRMTEGKKRRKKKPLRQNYENICSNILTIMLRMCCRCSFRDCLHSGGLLL